MKICCFFLLTLRYNTNSLLYGWITFWFLYIYCICHNLTTDKICSLNWILRLNCLMLVVRWYIRYIQQSNRLSFNDRHKIDTASITTSHFFFKWSKNWSNSYAFSIFIKSTWRSFVLCANKYSNNVVCMCNVNPITLFVFMKQHLTLIQ